MKDNGIGFQNSDLVEGSDQFIDKLVCLKLAAGLVALAGV